MWSQKFAEDTQKRYKKGMRVVLDADMNDESPNAPKAGARGIVQCVDGMGTIFVSWDNGSGLGLIPGEDVFHIEQENERT